MRVMAAAPLAGALCWAALAGCASNPQRPPEAALAASASPESASAVESIAEARCARESRCDNVGPGKDYASTKDCLLRVGERWKGDLDARACPGGPDDAGLNECLNEIRADDCGSPFDTLERVAACTAGQMCVD